VLTKALRDKDQGLPVSADRQTVQQFVNYWLDHATGSLRPRTLEGYRLLARKHVTPSLGHYSLQQLTPQHVQALLNQKSKSGLAPQTVGHIRTVLRRALNFAMKWGLVGRNVATLVGPPRVERPEVQPLTPEQAQRFLQAVQNERMGPLYAITLLLGVRQGEALGLRWTDIADLEGKNPNGPPVQFGGRAPCPPECPWHNEPI
jgi:integrase